MAAPATPVNAPAPPALDADDLVVVQALLASRDSPMADRARAVLRRTAVAWPRFAAIVVAQELAPRCLRVAGDLGLVLPADVRRAFEQAAAAADVRARRQRLTLFAFLEAAAARAVPVLLLKGAALANGDYDDPAERHMIDVDVLVRPRDVARACAAAAALGHVPGPRALPALFHRLVHFELLLQPAFDGMVPIDLHWRLQHESLLLTVDHEDLWRRCADTVVCGRPAARLPREAEWLHVATHFFANRGAVPADAGERELGAVLLDRSGSLHGKWLRDLVIATERLAAGSPPGGLVAAARSWSATDHAAAALAIVQPLLSPRAQAFAAAVGHACALSTPTPGRAATALRAWQQERAHPALGFRPRALLRLGSWLWPPATWFGRPQPSAVRLLWRRGCHAAAVLLRSLAAALLLPIALAVRPLAARRRRAWQRRARAPAGVMAHVQRMAAFECAVAASAPSRGAGS
jgi:hypothetical protein